MRKRTIDWGWEWRCSIGSLSVECLKEGVRKCRWRQMTLVRFRGTLFQNLDGTTAVLIMLFWVPSKRQLLLPWFLWSVEVNKRCQSSSVRTWPDLDPSHWHHYKNSETTALLYMQAHHKALQRLAKQLSTTWSCNSWRTSTTSVAGWRPAGSSETPAKNVQLNPVPYTLVMFVVAQQMLILKAHTAASGLITFTFPEGGQQQTRLFLILKSCSIYLLIHCNIYSTLLTVWQLADNFSLLCLQWLSLFCCSCIYSNTHSLPT